MTILKTLTAITAAALIALPAMGEPEKSKQEVCAIYGDLAESIMLARQNGMRMSDTVELIASGDDEWFNSYATEKVMAAFGHNRYETPEIREKLIADFRDDAELECYQIYAAGGQ